MTLATALSEGVRHGHDGGPRFFFPLLLLMIIGGVFLVRRRKRAWFAANGGDGPGFAGRHGNGPDTPPMTPPSSSAMTLLQERFARGEIGEAEFRQRRSVLQGDPVGTVPAPPAPPVEPVSATPPTATVAPEPPDEVIRAEAVEPDPVWADGDAPDDDDDRPTA